jgi:hypothetical protein
METGGRRGWGWGREEGEGVGGPRSGKLCGKEDLTGIPLINYKIYQLHTEFH